MIMSQLVIRGHATRGKEVIEILKMLGGNNANNYYGNYYDGGYYINENGYIEQDFISHIEQNIKFIIYTLEQFEEMFPYKIGDKVQYKGATSCGSVFEVEKMRWANNHIRYTIKGLQYNNCHSIVTAGHWYLQPFEEETMETNTHKGYCTTDEETKNKSKKAAWFTFWDNDFADKVELDLSNRELIQEDGKWFVVKKKKEYPKTYEECCELLSLGEDGRLYTKGYKASLIQDFQKLLICRDAYRQIAGEQMGLGKPWEPSANEEGKTHALYYNRYTDSFDKCSGIFESNAILDFPTKEMRDTFYENFKKLIEETKELL